MKQTISSAKTLQGRSRVLACAIAAALCALMACMAFALSGCKPPQGQLAANAALAEMSAIQQKNPESISYLPEVSQAKELEQIGISQEEFFDWWLDGFTSSLGDVEMNGEENDAKIFASITCRQLEPLSSNGRTSMLLGCSRTKPRSRQAQRKIRWNTAGIC